MTIADNDLADNDAVMLSTWRASRAAQERERRRQDDDLAAENERLRVQVRNYADVLDVLQCLYDHQNGCPLPKYEKGWDDAMARARAILYPPQTEALP